MIGWWLGTLVLLTEDSYHTHGSSHTFIILEDTIPFSDSCGAKKLNAGKTLMHMTLRILVMFKIKWISYY